MALTERQVQYRKWLKTDQWRQLRKQAIERDGGLCVRPGCASNHRLQAHHKRYRGRFEDTLLEDLETLCQACHRREHGLWVKSIDPFDILAQSIRTDLNRGVLPTEEQMLDLLWFAGCDDDDWNVSAILRQKATMRILTNSERMWSLWLGKDKAVFHRLWTWSEQKREQMQLYLESLL